jgi:hypothetical protein
VLTLSITLFGMWPKTLNPLCSQIEISSVFDKSQITMTRT